MKNRCVIVAGGDCCVAHIGLIAETDYVIAADSGLNILLDNNIKPDLIVGDFDSFKGELPSDIETIKLPEKKDDTDLLFAGRVGVEKDFNNFLVLGGYGSRPDQNFAMYSTLLWLVKSGKGIRASAVSTGFEVTVISNSLIELYIETDEYLSVFAFGGDAYGVELKNADYELTDAILTPEFPVGVSNCKSEGGTVSISVRSGNLLIFKLNKKI